MKKYSTEYIKNFCLAGTGNCGKTSLAEAIFFNAGFISRMGRSEEGNMVCDYNEDEIRKKMSLSLGVVNFEYNGYKLNLIDTPGYPDFVGEVLCGLKAVESAVLVINGEIGVDAVSEDVYTYIKKMEIPFVIFINKFDKPDISLDKIIQEIKTKLEIKPILLTYPLDPGSSFSSYVDLLKNKGFRVEGTNRIKEIEIPNDVKDSVEEHRNKLIEEVVSFDDELTEKYLEGEEIILDEMRNCLRDAFLSPNIVFCFCGCATRNIGVNNLLEFIVNNFPPPRIQKKKDFSGFVFKTTSEPGMGQINYVKVFSGNISNGMDIFNFTRNLKERVTQICFPQAKKRVETSNVIAGDICALVKLKSTRTNDLLGVDVDGITQVEFPESTVEMAVYSKSKGDEGKLANAFSSILLEDPTLKFKYNPEIKEMIISGIGKMQIENAIERIRNRYKVNVELREPRVPYKETITITTESEGKYKRQSGGRGQYGHCFLRLEPLERGGGFEFVDKIFGGKIPKNYIPSIEKGVKEAMNEGVIAGYPVVDLKITLFDGSYHEVDSSDIAFKIAGAMALKKGVNQARPTILEPIMNLEITIPEEYLGSVMGDLNSRRGRILGIDKSGKRNVLKVQVPLAEIFGYATDLRSLTKGAGKFKMWFSHREEVPAHIKERLIAEYQKSKTKE